MGKTSNKSNKGDRDDKGKKDCSKSKGRKKVASDSKKVNIALDSAKKEAFGKNVGFLNAEGNMLADMMGIDRVEAKWIKKKM